MASSSNSNTADGNQAQLDWDSLPEHRFEATNKLDHLGFSSALNALVSSSFEGDWSQLVRSQDHRSDYTVQATDVLVDFLATTSQQVLKKTLRP